MKQFDFNISYKSSCEFEWHILKYVIGSSILANRAQETLIFLYKKQEENFNDESISYLIKEYEDLIFSIYDLLGEIGEYLNDLYSTLGE